MTRPSSSFTNSTISVASAGSEKAGYLEAIEVLGGANGDVISLERQQMLTTDAPGWLNASVKELADNKSAASSLRILVISRSSFENDRGDAIYGRHKNPDLTEEFLSECQLPMASPSMFQKGIWKTRRPGGLFYHNSYLPDARDKFRCTIRHNTHTCLTGSFDYDTNSTRAIYYDGDAYRELSFVIPVLLHGQYYLHHPLSLYMLITQYWTRRAAYEREELEDEHFHIADVIAMEPWIENNKGDKGPGTGSEFLHRHGEIADQLRRATQGAVALYFHTQKLQALLKTLKRCNEHCESILHERHAALPNDEPTRHMAERQHAEMTYSLESLEDEAIGYSLYAEYIQSNMAVQLANLNRMATTQDTQISIQIAKDGKMLALESKRDSTSMKTLAAVSIIFLPGTFVASIFAIPMFNWSAAAGSVVNRRFWIYWVVTIPLTLLVIVSWLAWFQFKTARQKLEDTTAAHDLFIEIDKKVDDDQAENETEERQANHYSRTPLKKMWDLKGRFSSPKRRNQKTLTEIEA